MATHDFRSAAEIEAATPITAGWLVGQWTCVYNQLPSHYRLVLVWRAANPGVAYCDKTGKWRKPSGKPLKGDVVYWRELPAPPSGCWTTWTPPALIEDAP
jgi:uncharacterized protein YndB with AHSA1/START domain